LKQHKSSHRDFDKHRAGKMSEEHKQQSSGEAWPQSGP
jgi:hypothetical protein